MTMAFVQTASLVPSFSSFFNEDSAYFYFYDNNMSYNQLIVDGKKHIYCGLYRLHAYFFNLIHFVIFHETFHKKWSPTNEDFMSEMKAAYKAGVKIIPDLAHGLSNFVEDSTIQRLGKTFYSDNTILQTAFDTIMPYFQGWHKAELFLNNCKFETIKEKLFTFLHLYYAQSDPSTFSKLYNKCKELGMSDELIQAWKDAVSINDCHERVHFTLFILYPLVYNYFLVQATEQAQGEKQQTIRDVMDASSIAEPNEDDKQSSNEGNPDSEQPESSDGESSDCPSNQDIDSDESMDDGSGSSNDDGQNDDNCPLNDEESEDVGQSSNEDCDDDSSNEDGSSDTNEEDIDEEDSFGSGKDEEDSTDEGDEEFESESSSSENEDSEDESSSSGDDGEDEDESSNEYEEDKSNSSELTEEEKAEVEKQMQEALEQAAKEINQETMQHDDESESDSCQKDFENQCNEDGFKDDSPYDHSFNDCSDLDVGNLNLSLSGNIDDAVRLNNEASLVFEDLVNRGDRILYDLDDGELNVDTMIESESEGNSDIFYDSYHEPHTLDLCACFAIDCSGSMFNSERIECSSFGASCAAVSAVRNALVDLGVFSSALLFDEGCAVVSDYDSPKDDIVNAYKRLLNSENYLNDGGTDLLPTLKYIKRDKYLNSFGGDKFICILTDGSTSNSYECKEIIQELLKDGYNILGIYLSTERHVDEIPWYFGELFEGCGQIVIPVSVIHNNLCRLIYEYIVDNFIK